MNGLGYRELKVWDRAMELSVEVYLATDLMPDAEKYGLVSQMQRAAVSVASNIAEGHARSHLGDYLKHLSYARGSLAELETQLEISVRVKRLSRDNASEAWRLSQETGRMLTGLIQSLQPNSTACVFLRPNT